VDPGSSIRNARQYWNTRASSDERLIKQNKIIDLLKEKYCAGLDYCFFTIFDFVLLSGRTNGQQTDIHTQRDRLTDTPILPLSLSPPLSLFLSLSLYLYPSLSPFPSLSLSLYPSLSPFLSIPPFPLFSFYRLSFPRCIIITGRNRKKENRCEKGKDIKRFFSLKIVVGRKNYFNFNEIYESRRKKWKINYSVIFVEIFRIRKRSLNGLN
jgi:hypothetical protein